MLKKNNKITFPFSKCSLPDGRPESEVIPTDVRQTLNKVKDLIHDLEGTIRDRKRYYHNLKFQDVPSVSAVDSRFEETLINFLLWLKNTEDIISREQPLTSDLIQLREQQIALSVSEEISYQKAIVCCLGICF